MIPALAKYDDATLIAELEARSFAALLRSVPRASAIEPWQEDARSGSLLLKEAIEQAGVRP